MVGAVQGAARGPTAHPPNVQSGTANCPQLIWTLSCRIGRSIPVQKREILGQAELKREMKHPGLPGTRTKQITSSGRASAGSPCWVSGEFSRTPSENFGVPHLSELGYRGWFLLSRDLRHSHQNGYYPSREVSADLTTWSLPEAKPANADLWRMWIYLGQIVNNFRAP